MFNHKRLIVLLFVFSLLFLILNLRLVHIQLLSAENFSKHGVNLLHNAIQQRQEKFILNTGRGSIVDRNGHFLTGKQTHVIVMFPTIEAVDQQDELINLANTLDLDTTYFFEVIENIKEPTVLKVGQQTYQINEREAQMINEMGIQGLLGLPYELRYNPKKMHAQHLIGYIGQNRELIHTHYHEDWIKGKLNENSVIGISGTERTFQPFLQGLGETTLSYYVDGKGNPLKGLDIKYVGQSNPFYPLSIKMTIDQGMQSELEKALHQHSITEGAAIVLDVHTSEIVALASLPEFSEAMEQPAAWENKAYKRYPPGSIFKIVVAAAALEEELVTPLQPFQCDGEIEGTHFHCWKKEGHGVITFQEGFAQSCNIVFGQLAQALGSEKIIEYAHKLGLLTKNGWHTDSLFKLGHFSQLDKEDMGQVYDPHRTEEEREDASYLLQTGIGQLDVQVTPLATANMLATIARGGLKYQVKSVSDILYKTGSVLHRFSQQKIEGPSISPYTAYQLQKLLALVIEKGTASDLKHVDGSVSGKTGTAQFPIDPTQPHIMKNHYWFAGYYPRNHPKYAIVVLALNKDAGSKNVAIDVFSEFIQYINAQNKEMIR